MVALTSDIAKFVATVEPGVLPERANFGARIGMLDCVGTMIAGADEEAVKLVARMVPTSTTNDGAPEIPGGRNLSAPDAALVNGVAAHVLDYDDVGMDGHPSARSRPLSSPRAGRSARAARRRSPPMSRATRCGRCCRSSSPARCTSAASTRPRSGERSRPRPPARGSTAQCRGDHERDRGRGLARGRDGGELRHDDEVAARRAHRAVRRARGAAREVRLHGVAGRRWSTGRASCTRIRIRASLR